jgi:putative transposase
MIRQRNPRSTPPRQVLARYTVPSLYTKGMTTGDIANHLADVYGSEVPRDLIFRVTDTVVEQMQQWQGRPLDAIYPVSAY